MSELSINSIQPEGSKLEYIGLSENDRIKLHKAATAFEAMMLKQLLKSTSSKETRGMFGGGMAEEFFADHLNNERAKSMAESGGFGVAAMIEAEILRSYESRLKPESPHADKVNDGVKKRQAQSSYGSHD